VSRIRNNNFFLEKYLREKRKKLQKNIDKIKIMLIDMPNLRGEKEKTTKKFMKCFLQIFHSIVQL
jgi:hypothetical protein